MLVAIVDSDSLPQCGRELVDPLVNTPPKGPSSRGGAIARGSFACSGHWAFHGEYR